MKPLYKVGDVVLIKSKWDDGYSMRDYRYLFTSDMITRHGGKFYTITSVLPAAYPAATIPDDSYRYTLDAPDNFSWASSMFDPEF